MDSNFRAFISYSHKDSARARWLHGQLESYRVPSRLVGRITSTGVIGARVGKVFRDRDELPVSADLSGAINEALKATQFLIVLCSLASAQSKWVNQEVVNFKRLKGADSIIAVIVDGEPYASGMPGRADEECFCPALRFQIDGSGALTNIPAEPVAADLRPGKDSKRLVKMKVLAGLLGVGLDELIRRDTARRYRLMLALTVGTTALALSMAVLSVFAITAREAAEVARAAAVRQKTQAEALVDFLLGDLSTRLQPVGRLDLLDSVAQRSLDYFSALNPEDMDDDSLARRVSALNLLGDIETAKGNFRTARGIYSEAAKVSATLLARDPGNSERRLAQVQSLYLQAISSWELGEFDAAESDFRAYETAAINLMAANPDRLEFRSEVADAKTNLGMVAFNAGRNSEALVLFRDALAIFAENQQREPGSARWPTDVATLDGWASAAAYSSGRLIDALGFAKAETEILHNQLDRDATDSGVRESLAQSHRMTGLVALDLGRLDEAQVALGEAVDLAGGLVTQDSKNAFWKALEARARLGMAEYALETGQVELLKQHLAAVRPLARDLAAQDSGNIEWRVQVFESLGYFEAELTALEGDARTALDVAVAVEGRLAKLLVHPRQKLRALRLKGRAAALVARLLAAAGRTADSQEKWAEIASALNGDATGGNHESLALSSAALRAVGRGDDARALEERLRDAGFARCLSGPFGRTEGASGEPVSCAHDARAMPLSNPRR